ncbi:hypothetical protein GA0115242_146411 [Streptomyces sp. SolWspMP-5a-2]|nr:hypothetical protein GA0115242_146411 [Streptomyces sp. SolWspMP-5a-2]
MHGRSGALRRGGPEGDWSIRCMSTCASMPRRGSSRSSGRSRGSASSRNLRMPSRTDGSAVGCASTGPPATVCPEPDARPAGAAGLSGPASTSPPDMSLRARAFRCRRRPGGWPDERGRRAAAARPGIGPRTPTPARFRTRRTPPWSAARWTACCSTLRAGGRKRSSAALPWPPSWGGGPAAGRCATRSLAGRARRAIPVWCVASTALATHPDARRRRCLRPALGQLAGVVLGPQQRPLGPGSLPGLCAVVAALGVGVDVRGEGTKVRTSVAL